MAGRWRAVLRPLAPLVSQTEAFQAMVVGFATSIVVPARGGELARAEWLGRRTGLPRATILGSILLDHLVAASGLFTAVALLPFLLDLPGWLHSGIWLALAVFAVAVSFVLVLRPKAGMPALGGTALPRGRVAAAVAGFLARARLGLTAMGDRRRSRAPTARRSSPGSWRPASSTSRCGPSTSMCLRARAFSSSSPSTWPWWSPSRRRRTSGR